MIFMKGDSEYEQQMMVAQRRIVITALRAAGGNCTEAAEALGIHRNTLQRILRQHGLTVRVVRLQMRIVNGAAA